MSDEKLTPSILYTTEAKESKEKTEDELSTPDPEITIAWSAIKDNTIDEEK